MKNSKLKHILFRLAEVIPFTKQFKAKRWVDSHYMNFAWKNMEYIFLSIARFAHINRPIDGYYMEFGSHEGRTMSLAWKHFQHLFNWEYLAFDSFEGLPEIQDIDKQEIWKKGKLKTGVKSFLKIVKKSGMPLSRIKTIKGFYDQSLTNELAKSLLPKKAAVIYIDCDLYESTVPVLKFIIPFLQKGTIIVFDDWNCFHGDPDHGERRAWREFLNNNSYLKFEPFVSTNEANSFICIQNKINT
tara:strand:+ start:234 stop:962 length:729 start_codon:yes stop_codon:yes gene_type:complete